MFWFIALFVLHIFSELLPSLRLKFDPLVIGIVPVYTISDSNESDSFS